MIPVDVDLNFFVWSVLHTYEELCVSCCFYILGPGGDILCGTHSLQIWICTGFDYYH